MSRFFTYSWQYAEAQKKSEGEPLGHAAGSRFSSRGIEPGDFVYIVAVHGGQLYLLGKMQVEKIVSKDDAHRIFGAEPYDAPEHLIASACTPARLTEVPVAITKGLRFIGGSRNKGLIFREEDILDPQTMRVIRELVPDSASRLDDLLGEMVAFNPPGQPSHREGAS
ncbi:MAG: hypothetical protein WDZ59_16990 [Pirellulales bacterium]